jgi:hypothetical protein
MKRLLLITALMLLAVPAMAADVTFAWDSSTQPWEKVRIYERTGTVAPFTYTQKVEVAGNLTTATVTGVTPGVHYYIARSYIAPWESADSNVVNTGNVPNAPGNVRITIVINVNP